MCSRATETAAETRQRLRQARRLLSGQACRAAGEQIAARISTLESFQQAVDVACFLARDGEVATGPLLELCWSLGKRTWLPVTSRQQRLAFAHYHSDTKLLPGAFKIPEPDPRESEFTDPATLDVVLTPLVAFDSNCRRIGMGGGYYDRTFGFLLQEHRPGNPVLIGIAHDFQHVEHIEAQRWDVPLQAVATPSRIYHSGDWRKQSYQIA